MIRMYLQLAVALVIDLAKVVLSWLLVIAIMLYCCACSGPAPTAEPEFCYMCSVKNYAYVKKSEGQEIICGETVERRCFVSEPAAEEYAGSSWVYSQGEGHYKGERVDSVYQSHVVHCTRDEKGKEAAMK